MSEENSVRSGGSVVEYMKKKCAIDAIRYKESLFVLVFYFLERDLG